MGEGRGVDMYKSIRVKILLFLIATFIFSVLISTLNSFFQQRKMLLDYEIERANKTVSIYVKQLDTFINDSVTTLTFASNQIADGQVEGNSFFEHLRYLNELSDQKYINIIYIDAFGQVTDMEGRGTSASEREYYKTATEMRQPYIISEPILGKISKTGLFTIIIPKYNVDGFEHAIGGAITLDELYGEVSELKMTPSSYTMIIDGQGHVLAHPQKDVAMYKSVGNIYSGYDEKEDIVLKLTHSEEGQRIVTGPEGVRELMTFASIPKAPGWKLVVITPLESIYEGTEPVLGINIAMAVLVLLIFIFVSKFLIESAIHPLDEMSKAFNESMNHGFTDINLEIENKEMDYMIKDYNRIVREKRKEMASLEALVEKRTEAFNQLREGMSQQNDILVSPNDDTMYLSGVDYVTELNYQMALFNQLEEFRKAIETDRLKSCCLLFVNLDNLNHYNERFGHRIGDRILKLVARKIRNNVKKQDMVARYGGDEFVIALPNGTLEGGEIVCQRLQKVILAEEGLVDLLEAWTGQRAVMNERQWLGLSIGISMMSTEGKTHVETMIQQADAHMCKHKHKK